MLKISISIYKGKTDLIHDYHQTKVTDKAAYGRAFGRATLFVGLFIGIAMIIAVQIKYNKGIF
jgi:hypothetical protein